jgi:hypothetical protein
MKQKNNKNWAPAIFLIFFLIMLALQHLKYINRVKNYSGTSIGYITDVRKRTPNLMIETIANYEFTADSVLYKREEILSVGLNIRPFIKRGDKLNVYYDLHNPSNATAIENKDFLPTYVITALIIVLILI